MKIIGLGHRKRVGKDTLARELLMEFALHQKQVRIMAFAGPLYDLTEQLYSWAGMKDMAYYFENQTEKEKVLIPIGKTPREILISLGMSVRDIFADTWIELLKERVTMTTDVDLVIIVDCRFENEAEAIKSLGGEVWRIDRPEIPHTDDPADIALANYDDWDRIIQNSGNEQQFRNLARHIALELLSANGKCETCGEPAVGEFDLGDGERKMKFCGGCAKTYTARY